jgi:hypothetical protein
VDFLAGFFQTLFFTPLIFIPLFTVLCCIIGLIVGKYVDKDKKFLVDKDGKFSIRDYILLFVILAIAAFIITEMPKFFFETFVMHTPWTP